MKKRRLLTTAIALFTVVFGFSQTHITTIAGLRAIQSNNSYILDADLDLSPLTNGLGVGDLTNVVFDGNFHTLSNLTYDGQSRGGLFANLSGCTIKNLRVSNFTIAGSWAGSLAGHADNSTFYRCSSKNGDIESSGIGGGIVGHISGTSISECFVGGIVNGHDHVGGIVGHMESGSSVANSYTIADVATDSWQVGGIAGWGENASNSISNCFAGGTVSAGQGFTGGIVGATSGGNKAYVTITHCMAIQSKLTANSDIVKTNRIVGDDGSATFSNNYGLATMTWSDPKRTDPWGSNANGKDGQDITEAMVASSAFYTDSLPSWNFTNVWILSGSHPTLRMETFTPGSSGIQNAQLDNVTVGTAGGKIMISSPENSVIAIYDLTGKTIVKKVASATTEAFSIKGVFVVTVNTEQGRGIYKVVN